MLLCCFPQVPVVWRCNMSGLEATAMIRAAACPPALSPQDNNFVRVLAACETMVSRGSLRAHAAKRLTAACQALCPGGSSLRLLPGPLRVSYTLRHDLRAIH